MALIRKAIQAVDLIVDEDSGVLAVQPGGGPSAARNPGDGVTIGDTSTMALAANAGRREATFVNDSDETIYLRLGTDAVMNSGIRLNANGGSYTTTVYTGIVTAICVSGGKNLCVSEV